MMRISAIYQTIWIWIFCIPSIFCLTSSGQSPNYTIESFQGTYIELATYESMKLRTGFDPLWEYEFQLDFPFPFYDSAYSKLKYYRSAWGSFTEDQDLALQLMEFHAYIYDPWHPDVDTTNIPSDVRFSHVLADGVRAFVIQFTKMRLSTDPSILTHDSYINFQIWLYENGVLEVHFGDINLDHSPNYVPGEGFYRFYDNGEMALLGPHMAISDPYDEENAIGLEGAYNDYEVVDDAYAILTTLPPTGWVIQFKPTYLSLHNLTQGMEQIMLYPNPTNDILRLPRPDARIIVMDGMGRIVYSGWPQGEIFDVSSFPKGIYYLQSISDDKLAVGRFIRL